MYTKPYFLFAVLSFTHATTTNTSVSFISQTSYRTTRTTAITSAHITIVTLKYDYIAEKETVDPLEYIVGQLKSANPAPGELNYYVHNGNELHGDIVTLSEVVTSLIDVHASDWHKVTAAIRFSYYTSSVIYSAAEEAVSEQSSSICQPSSSSSTSECLASTSTLSSISGPSTISTVLTSSVSTSTALIVLSETTTPLSSLSAASTALANTSTGINAEPVYGCVRDTGDTIDVAKQLVQIIIVLTVSDLLWKDCIVLSKPCEILIWGREQERHYPILVGHLKLLLAVGQRLSASLWNVRYINLVVLGYFLGRVFDRPIVRT